MFVYKFLDSMGEVLYVGRTSNFRRRVKTVHFTDRGHLPVQCYRDTELVKYVEVSSVNESKMYEIYLIQKYRPKYNITDTGGGVITFGMPALDWLVYKPERFEGVTRDEVLDSFLKLLGELNTEYEYMINYLRGKDRVSWLEKLDGDERNEYLGVIYMMERYVKGLDDLRVRYKSKFKDRV